MAVSTTDEERDYPSLYLARCDCAGPQPSLGRHRADEHAAACPYRKEVEGVTTAKVSFVGDWLPGEEEVAAGAARAAEEFLGERMARPWVFVKGARRFSLTQGGLFKTEVTAAKLPDLLEHVRRAVAARGSGGEGGAA